MTLDELIENAQHLSWVPDTGRIKGSTAYRGTGDGVVLLVIDFDIEYQGFPKGSRGYDGTAMVQGVITHLNRKQAETAFKKAEQARKARNEQNEAGRGRVSHRIATHYLRDHRQHNS